MNKDLTELSQVDYNLPSLGKTKWLLIVLGVFLFSLFTYYPLSAQVEKFIITKAAQIPGCPIKIDDIGFDFFMPKIKLRKAHIPARCLGQRGKGYYLKNTNLNFRGFTFSPLGPHFKLETNFLSNNLQALITATPSQIFVNMKGNTLDLALISKEIDKVNLAGIVNLDGSVKLVDQKIDKLNLNIRSNDFTVLAQSISGLKLTKLSLNKIFIKAATESQNKLKVSDIVLGDVNSPIRSNFKGDIKLNQNNLMSSTLNLTGEVAFSKDFIDKYAIVNIMMGQFNKKNNFYQIQVKGPLQLPSFKSPRIQ